MIVLLSVVATNLVINRMRGYENSRRPFSLRAWLRALYDAKFALAIPVIILGGIYTGIFTPTESAAVAVAVALTVGLAQRTIRLARFPRDARDVGARERRDPADHRRRDRVRAGAHRAERAAVAGRRA